MVGLRSGNEYDATPAMDDGPSGNLEMDANSGTSSSSGEMDAQGTSAAEMDASGTSGNNSGRTDEPRSSFSAAESEHRSRPADVDGKPRPSPAAVAEHDKTPAASLRGAASLSHHRQASVDAIVDGGVVLDDSHDGFVTPKRTTRSSRGSPSPALETTPLFFGSWFGGGDATTETESETDASVRKHAFIKKWAEYTEADGLGDIPSEWNVPSHRSVSPVDSKMELPFDEVMAEISRGMSPTTRDKIQRRAARMKKQQLNSPQSVSLTSHRDSQRSGKSGNNSLHTVLVSHNTAVAATETRSSLATTSPRHTAYAKAKGRDPRERPNIVPAGVLHGPSSSSSSTSSDVETPDEDVRRRQIEADSHLAAMLQHLLDERRAADLAEAKSKAKRDNKTRSSSHRAERNRTSVADKDTRKGTGLSSKPGMPGHTEKPREKPRTKDERHDVKSSKHSSTPMRGNSGSAPPHRGNETGKEIFEGEEVSQEGSTPE
ncbi:hypothetical protein DFH06DRAFT_1143933 [Mycena polygramma]|nr:hypothetical protein DFH06DRAFT_1143933 [Mycena polygramma]